MQPDISRHMETNAGSGRDISASILSDLTFEWDSERHEIYRNKANVDPLQAEPPQCWWSTSNTGSTKLVKLVTSPVSNLNQQVVEVAFVPTRTTKSFWQPSCRPPVRRRCQPWPLPRDASWRPDVGSHKRTRAELRIGSLRWKDWNILTIYIKVKRAINVHMYMCVCLCACVIFLGVGVCVSYVFINRRIVSIHIYFYMYFPYIYIYTYTYIYILLISYKQIYNSIHTYTVYIYINYRYISTLCCCIGSKSACMHDTLCTWNLKTSITHL